MKKIILITSVFFISSSVANVVFALKSDYTVVTQSYVTRNTNGEVANGASDEVTATTKYDATCYLDQNSDLKGSILVTINNTHDELYKGHLSFTQLDIPAQQNNAGLYGFEEDINGTNIKSRGPYLVTCRLESKF